MININVINKIIKMSELVLKMWQDTHLAFMEHNRELVTAILNIESKVNDLEKEITTDLAEIGRNISNLSEKKIITSYTDIVGDLELIGDYCKDILERVEIKIEEKLLFSEEAVEDYNKLYYSVEENLKKVVKLLKQEVSPDKANDIVLDKENILKKLNTIRQNHDERLISGKCSPLASNMFLNIVDFTVAVYNHIENIAERLIKLR